MLALDGRYTRVYRRLRISSFSQFQTASNLISSDTENTRKWYDLDLNRMLPKNFNCRKTTFSTPKIQADNRPIERGNQGIL